ncbi:MAG: hypothetical protein RI956_514 [Pseudomonadota bacterium]|jgi:hypothetical protein
MNHLKLNKLNGLKLLILTSCFVILSSCGGGSGGVGNTFTTESSVPVTVLPTLSLSAYSDSANNIRKMVAGSSITATVLLKNTKGLALPDTLVEFKLLNSTGLVSMIPASGKTLTDSAGIAKIVITTDSLAPADTFGITASTTVDKLILTSEPTWSVEILPAKPVLGVPTLAGNLVAPLPANSIASIKIPVTILDSITQKKIPLKSLSSSSIQASSTCSLQIPPLASLDIIGVTDGIATINYKNLGCITSPDIVRVSMSGVAESVSISIPVASAAVSELRYISATPSSALVIKGAGGVGRQESGTVTFKLINSSGNPVPDAIVNFEASTIAGGITVNPSKGKTDAQGQVSTTVNSGYLPTPVSILATTVDLKTGEVFTSASSLLSISAGPAEQKSISMSFDANNIRGDDYDGNTANVTLRLADNWGNGVTDGTVINMITEGGKVAAADGSGSCITSNSTCTMTLTTQNFRPADRRVSVVAFAKGVEGFDDSNKNGLFDSGEFCGHLGSPFIDNNENGVHDDGELLIPNIFPSGNANNTYTLPKEYSACAVRNPTYVYAKSVVIFSGKPTAIIPTRTIPATFNNSCSPVVISFVVVDKNNNPIAAGSTITIDDALNIKSGAVKPSIVPSTTEPSKHYVVISPADNVCKPVKDDKGFPLPPSVASFSITATSGGDSISLPVSILQ